MSPAPPHWGATARIWGEGDVHHQVFPEKKITGRGNSTGSRPGQSTTDVPATHAFITLEMRPSIGGVVLRPLYCANQGRQLIQSGPC
jgi:hypothetical protein